MSGLSLFGGIFAFTKYSSFPALFLSFGIAAASATSAMRIRDGMDWGYEGAAGARFSVSPDDLPFAHSHTQRARARSWRRLSGMYRPVQDDLTPAADAKGIGEP